MKKILSKMRRAITDYNMISDGDKIAIGVSGGKDSLTLLYAMVRLKSFLPQNFDIIAVTLDLDFKDFNKSKLFEIYNSLDIQYHIEKTFISKIVFEIKQEKNPCSLCSNLKRGAIYNVAKKLGCNKVAFGHHMDDVIETLLLAMFYEGRLHTFSPVTYLDRKDITLIRPMIYTSEKLIQSFVKRNSIQEIRSGCYVDGKTKREEIKQLLKTLYTQNKYIKNNLFGAIQRAHLSGW